MVKKWVFPYEEIKKNSRIVLYGAGKIGKEFRDQLRYTEYCEVVLWTDSNYDNDELKEMGVKSPLLLGSIEFDVVVVAIRSMDACSEIVKFLNDRHIPDEKIWTPFHDLKKYKEQFIDFTQKPDIRNLDIAFVIPAPIEGSGGHRNFFRAVKYLRDFGHKMTVYYIQCPQTPEIVKEMVSKWFFDMKDVTFIKYEGTFFYHDVGVATWWETAYLLKGNREKFREVFYFVQDYEAYFYPVSSEYILAENSYQLGMTHICSGAWCKKILQERFKAEAVSFQFPLDTSIYNMEIPRNKTNKNIIFFAKPEMPRRCFSLGIKALEIFHKKMPEVEIILFGSNHISEAVVPFKATILKLLPTIQDLAQLYRNADLGIVFSTTNPSLVPYEMLSCGCPVADLNLEFAVEKYGGNPNHVFLFDPQPEIFAEQLYEVLNDDGALKKKGKYGHRWVKAEFPSEAEMARIVEAGIINKVSTGKCN